MGGEVLQTSLEKNAIYRQTQITLRRAAERGQGGGQISPGPEVLGGPENVRRPTTVMMK